MSALLLQEQLRVSTPPDSLPPLFPWGLLTGCGAACHGDGFGIRRWQQGNVAEWVGPASGQAQTFSTNPVLRVYQSLEQCYVIGMSTPILIKGALGFGDTQGPLLSGHAANIGPGCASGRRPGPWSPQGLSASLPLDSRAVAWGGAGPDCSLGRRGGGGRALPHYPSSLICIHHSHTLGTLLSPLDFKMLLSQMINAFF